MFDHCCFLLLFHVVIVVVIACCCCPVLWTQLHRVICEQYGVTITLGDLLRCLEEEFLNDNIIDWALKSVQLRCEALVTAPFPSLQGSTVSTNFVDLCVFPAEN